MRTTAWATLMVATLSGCVCGPPPPDTPGRFGEVTSAIIIVNPRINQGSTTSSVSGDARANVEIRAADLPAVRTDATGLALIEDLPTGSVPLKLDSGEVSLQVVNPKELYDVVVAYRPNGVEHVIPPVRYPLGGAVTVVEPGTSLAAAAANDGAIILLKPGSYPGGLELRSEGVLIFGAWSTEEGPLSTIEGDVSVFGGANRIRGVRITGRLSSAANGFSAAFCTVGSATITGNSVSLLRNVFTAGSATVPSSAAVLVDNQGIP